MENKVSSASQIINKRSVIRSLRKNFPFLLLIAPVIIYFIIWHYLPMFGIVIAFKNYNYADGILGSPWVGFDNFKFFFISQDAWRITRNTVCYSAVFIVVGTAAAVLVALLLNEIRNRMAIKFYQTVMILPNFLSWVVVSFITYMLFNPVLGICNQFLNFLGFVGADWYSEPKYWPFILTFTNIWKGIGMNVVIYYATLMGIDTEIYEAATTDGANGWQKTWHISIPSLVPLITITSILAVGNIFRGDFGLFYQIPRDVGALYPTTDVIDTYIYRGLREGDMGITAAVGFFQSFVGVILVLVTNWIVNKIEPDNSLF